MTGFVAEAGGDSVEDGYGASVLARFELQHLARVALGPEHRVCKCLRHRIDRQASPALLYSSARDRGFWGGLQQCGLLWVCAVCGGKITERRRAEVSTGLDRWRVGGGTVLFASLTYSHRAGLGIADAVEQFLTVRRWMVMQRAYRRFCERHGLRHTIRALECTYGDNGPHVHGHEGALIEGQSVDVAAFGRDLAGLWSGALGRFGLHCSDKHGVRVRDTDQAAAEYLVKIGHEPRGRLWGAADELTKAHVKRGGLGHLTAWDFLRLFGVTGDLFYRDLFREFVAAFRGRHQLQWSRGCRDALGLGVELTDAELAELPEDRLALVLAALSDREWRAVRGLHRQGAAVLACRGGSAEQVGAFLAGVVAEYEQGGGNVGVCA